MTLITFQDGKPVLRDGKVGTEQECCCGGSEDFCNLGASGQCEGGCAADDDSTCPDGCVCKCAWCVGYYTLDENFTRQDMTSCIDGYTLTGQSPLRICSKLFIGDNCEAVDAAVRPNLENALGGQQGGTWDDAGFITEGCFSEFP
jgi:hypothetical protein